MAMAQEYKCKLCGKRIGKGFFSDPPKFKCKKHGEICQDHVSETYGGSKCTVCNKPTVKYEFNNDTGRWQVAG
jgi:hypothetical protein